MAHPSSPPEGTAHCPFCAEPIRTEAKKCKHCGEYLDEHLRAEHAPRKWSPGLAAVLSFFIPGLGQFYKGSVGPGLFFILGTPVGYLLFIVPGLIMHVACIVDAYQTKPHSGNSPQPISALNDQELKASEDDPPMSKAQRIQLSMVGVGVVAAIVVVVLTIPRDPTAATQHHDYALMKIKYPWLNSCDATCETKLDSDMNRLAYIDSRSSCDVMETYMAAQGKFPEMQLAINDKAASMHCRGFPKTIGQIQTATVQFRSFQDQVNAFKAELPGAGYDVTDDKYSTTDVVWGAEQGDDSDTVAIYVTNKWNSIGYAQKLANAKKWQQLWASVHSPTDRNKAKIFIEYDDFTPQWGGSHTNGTDVWVR
jgi:hypothetical protein